MENILIKEVSNFNAYLTFDCGQSFRFTEKDGFIQGVALGELLMLRQDNNKLYLYNITEDDYQKTWKYYLDLDEDYDTINQDIFHHFGCYNDTIYKAAHISDGIRILRQDPWEALCSFIISQNNNIPRIKKIVQSLCVSLGEKKEKQGIEYYTFPSAETIFKAGIDFLNTLRMGFRAKYVYDAARCISNGSISLDDVMKMSFEKAEQTLMSIYGVGKKVADCTLLYGFHKTNAFPIDVWIKRVLSKYYPNGINLNQLGNYAGIAQQYLFHYERTIQKQGDTHDS